jgi:hypothetical protein
LCPLGGFLCFDDFTQLPRLLFEFQDLALIIDFRRSLTPRNLFR